MYYIYYIKHLRYFRLFLLKIDLNLYKEKNTRTVDILHAPDKC